MKARWLLAVCALLASSSRDARAEGEAPVARAAGEPRAGLALAGTYGVTNGHLAQLAQGVELRAMVLPTRFGDLGMVVGIEEGVADALVTDDILGTHHVRDHGFTDARLGAFVGWGAPWRARTWGFGLELGASEGIAARARYASPYGAAQLRLAFCDCVRIRPFVAWSGRAIPWHYRGETVLSTTLDLGLTLRL